MHYPSPSRLLRRCLVFFALLIVVICEAQTVEQYPVYPQKIAVDKPDAKLSFWRDQVHYPFAVHYASASDSHGLNWQVAYMDEYAGPAEKKSTAKILVLVHGRGANAATWGELMYIALQGGLRVIALDIPHYGKSIPGNMDKPVTRSLDDVRDVFYKIIVSQLQVKKAVYLGHSLGGQIVLGYAIRYPGVVERLVLESTGGLEQFYRSRLLNRAFEYDFQKWKSAWQPTGMFTTEFSRSPSSIEFDYYFRGDGNNPGYFLKDGDVPRFITEARKKMITGNENEYKMFIDSYIYDAFAVGIELQKSDPKNLNRRLTELRMPIFLAYGAKDPFFPVKIMSGNFDMKLHLIKPFFDRLNAEGNPPAIKIYPEAAHFIHTDIPAQFSSDVLRFISGKKPANLENVNDYVKGCE